MRFALAVHGGAYNIPDELIADHDAGCRRALEAGRRILASGGSALDAVQAAVVVLEDDPVFDAGTGSHLNREGIVECDAAIMNGATLAAGAVAVLREIKNPILVARRLLDRGRSLFLAGEGALGFALECGIPRVGPDALVVPRERRRWEEETVNGTGETAGSVFGGGSIEALGTVGAVARDHRGHLAAATSTGGTPGKRSGRVGDAPLIGCGTYADDRSAAISCTGWGESIIRVVLARRAAERVERGESPQRAAEGALEVLSDRVGGLGGMIVVRSGDESDSAVGVAFNTPRMARGFMIEGAEPVVASAR